MEIATAGLCVTCPLLRPNTWLPVNAVVEE